MGNPFDAVQRAALKSVHTLMGEQATWQPSIGGPVQSAVVLFNEPTGKHEIADVDWMLNQPMMEYTWEMFTNLKELVDNGNVEIVTIKGQEFYVQQIIRHYDGRTFRAKLNPKT